MRIDVLIEIFHILTIIAYYLVSFYYFAKLAFFSELSKNIIIFFVPLQQYAIRSNEASEVTIDYFGDVCP